MTLDKWSYQGWVCIHFNRKEEAPLYASITPAFIRGPRSWEVLARQVHIHPGVELYSQYNEEGRPGLDPIWWLQGEVLVEIGDEGVADVYPPKPQG